MNKKFCKFLTAIFVFIFLINNINFVQATSKYDRVAGKDRYETSLKISEQYSLTSDYAILVSGSAYADALCAGPLSKKYNAPILLNGSSTLNSGVKDKLKKLQTKKVFIIGGIGSLSSSIENSIKSLGIEVERIGGKDKYETSILIAERIDGTYEKNINEKKNVEKNTEQQKESDNKNDSNLDIKEETNKTVEEQNSNNSEINKLEDQNKSNDKEETNNLNGKDDVNTENNPNTNISSENLQQNSIDSSNSKDAINKSALEDDKKQTSEENVDKEDEKNIQNNKDNNNSDSEQQIDKKDKISIKSIVVVSGENFPDALSIAPFASMNMMPIILVEKNNIHNSIKQYVENRNIEHTYVIGSTGVISDNIKAIFPNAERIGGKDRYETNELVIEKFKDSSSKEKIYIASGEGFSDALATVAVAQKYNSPIVIIKDGISIKHQNYVKNLIGNYNQKYVIGGTGVINQNALYLIGLESKPPAPKPKPQPKPGIQPPNVPKYFYVMNAGETSRVYIKRYASAYSPNVGYTYGGLAEAKILKSSGNYYYIEAVDYDSGRLVRGYVSKSMVRSTKITSPYNILVDKSKQRVYIFKNGAKIKEFICSTGLDNTPTPSGRFLTGGKGYSFYASSSSICYFWTRINNNYLFHSVIYDLQGYAIKSEYVKLGKKASHGCIRLPYYDAKWIYDNVPRGTLVTIR